MVISKFVNAFSSFCGEKHVHYRCFSSKLEKISHNGKNINKLKICKENK